jgi:hypothetical protein
MAGCRAVVVVPSEAVPQRLVMETKKPTPSAIQVLKLQSKN